MLRYLIGFLLITTKLFAEDKKDAEVGKTSESAKSKAVCQVEVHYVWLRKKIENQVYVNTITQEGKDLSVAENLLQSEYAKFKSKGFELCRKEHENLAGCLTAKMLKVVPAYQVAEYTIKRTLEESIKRDCQAQIGQCKDVIVSKPKCSEIKPIEAEKEKSEDKK
jgi:hypothetical protein